MGKGAEAADLHSGPCGWTGRSAADLRAALRSRAIRLFLAIELLAGVLFVLRRGSDTPRPSCSSGWPWPCWPSSPGGRGATGGYAVPRPGARCPDALDPRAPGGRRPGCLGVRAAAAGAPAGRRGLGGWLWSAIRQRGWQSLPTRLARGPASLRAAAPPHRRSRVSPSAGPATSSAPAWPCPAASGSSCCLPGGPLRAARSRAAGARMSRPCCRPSSSGSSTCPLDLDPNHGDLLAAAANAVFFQASVGLIACLAFVRHRAAVPIGVAHALAIG